MVLDFPKLARVCGMLGSEHPGERASAALLADRIVRQAGLSWNDVLVPQLPPAGTARPGQREIEECLHHFHCLSPSQQAFVLGVRRYRRPSPRQLAVLRDITRQARERAAGNCPMTS